MLLQSRFEKLFQSYATLAPFYVERAKIILPIFVVIGPFAVVHENARDVMHGIRQIKQFIMVKAFAMRLYA